MCGIAGWIDWDRDLQFEKKTMAKMSATLANRGPDEQGEWISTHAALVHRRLTVVDPAGGTQPMIRNKGEQQYILIYNGELYNTEELRSELRTLGMEFSSHSDTEVLLQAYIAWGEACVEKFNGIFAFAIWDDSKETLFMARDRFGVKPLFYAQRERGLIFGSELKALLANPLVKPVIDAQGLSEIFVVGPARTPGHGVFKDVYDLKPGYCLVYNRDGMRLFKYWSLKSLPHEDSLRVTTEKVYDLVQDTIKRQLVADVPVCTFLSGGLDSSAISTFTAEEFAKEGKGRLHTYSIDYEDNDIHFQANSFQPNSDAHWIKMMSGYLKTVHHSIIVNTEQLVDALKDAVIANDRPGMADVDSSLYLFCKEVKKNATVALSGECADEVFGGYPWFYRSESLSANTFPWALATEERASLLSTEVKEAIKPVDYVAQRYAEALDEVPRFEQDSPAEERIREMFYLNITRFMTTLLDRKDRMSMATGLEVRVPFCDHRLVEYVWNIPWAWKNCDHREKGILRRALREILPLGIVERRKSPYPKTHNPSYLRAVKNNFESILGDSPLLPLLDMNIINTIIKSGDEFNMRPWFGQLMNKAQLFAYLLQVDFWLREYHISIEI